MSSAIVICGTDLSLLGTRQRILQVSGYEVLATDKPYEIPLLVQEHPLNALILCYSLTFEQQLLAIMSLRRYRYAAKSIVLVKSDRRAIPDGASISFSTSLGPKALVQTLRQLLLFKPGLACGTVPP